MLRRFVPIVICFAVLVPARAVRAEESAAAELLRRVPDDIGLCVVVSDLRGHGDQLAKQAWFKKVEDNPLVKAVLQSKEMRELEVFRGKVQALLGHDLREIRDEILGDAIVLGHQSTTPGRPEGDRGLFLLKARNAELLKKLVDKLNELQTQNKELTKLVELNHRGVPYYRRETDRATHFYAIQGPVLIVSSHDQLLFAALGRNPKMPSPVFEHLRRAKADGALFAAWFNPRTLDRQFDDSAKQKLDADGTVLDGLLKFWKGLDAVVVSMSDPARPEMRLTLLAGKDNDARTWLTTNAAASDLWSRLPEKSIMAGAGRLEFARLLQQFQNLAPEKDRANLQEATRYVGSATGLDFFRQLMPNIGPDIGFAVFRLDDNEPLPAGLVAIALKSEPKEAPVDKVVWNTIQLVGTFALFDHNKKSPGAAIQVMQQDQDGVAVKYLEQKKLFPPGVQPALALKDGYLVLGTSPGAIAQFRRGPAPVVVRDEVPLLKLSAGETAKMVERHREMLAAELQAKGRETPENARRIVDGLIGGIRIFDSVQVLQETSAGASSLIVRLVPAKVSDR